MTAKSPQPRPEIPPAAPPRAPGKKPYGRVEALEDMLRQERSNALYWHDKYRDTLPTTEPIRSAPPGLLRVVYTIFGAILGAVLTVIVIHG